MVVPSKREGPPTTGLVLDAGDFRYARNDKGHDEKPRETRAVPWGTAPRIERTLFLLSFRVKREISLRLETKPCCRRSLAVLGMTPCGGNRRKASAGAWQLEALTAEVEDSAVFHDLFDHHVVAHFIAGLVLAIVDIQNALGLVRGVNVDINHHLRQ